MASRRTLDETRTLLLDTGAQMLIDSGIGVTLGQINLMDVCREAGLKTAGSGYKIWPTQDAFRTDLLRHLADGTAETESTIEALIGAIAEPDDLPPLRELIRVFAAADFNANQAPDAMRLFIALWLASNDDKQLADALIESDTALLTGLENLYRVVADAYDLEFIPPFDVTMLATTLAGLTEGLLLREDIHPERVPADLKRPTGPDGALQEWHLHACAVEAIVTMMTRPRQAHSTGTQ